MFHVKVSSFRIDTLVAVTRLDLLRRTAILLFAIAATLTCSDAPAATITAVDKAGATWAGFGSGIPDLSGSDYLDGLTTPFTVGSGSTVHAAGATLTAGGLAVLNNGVGSTSNPQTVIVGTGSGAFVRLMIDLQTGAGNSLRLQEFNSYNMVTSDATRNYQQYNLYGSNADTSPLIDGVPNANGWSLIASVDEVFTNSTSRTGAVHIDEINQPFRFLLFDAFTDNPYTLYNGTHYVELDFFGSLEVAGIPEPSTGLLLFSGIAALSLTRRRRRWLPSLKPAAWALIPVLAFSLTAPANAALVSYWNFDESASGTGTAIDQAGSNNGTFTGSTTRTSGIIGTGAASYPGTNPAGVNVGNSLAFTSGIAIEAMVSNSTWTGTTFQEIFRKNDAGILLFSLQSGSILSFGLNGGGGYSEFDIVLDGTSGKPTVAQFTTGTHHLVANYDAASGLQEIYYDGGLIASRTFQAGPDIISGGAANAFIGSSSGSAESWNGLLDEIAIYNAPLTFDTIQAHYANVQEGLNYFAVPVPEPSSALLVAMGACLLMRRRRRNR